MSDIWFTEQQSKTVRFSIQASKILLEKQSAFQKIVVYESEEFGRFFSLDDLLMVTEKDEFVYHDMIVHVPMAVHPNVQNVLVIGAGDGGTLRELCRYASIQSIDMVEIDGEVVEVSKQFFPTLNTGFADPRVHLHIEDGVRFVKETTQKYDLIIVDSTDPFSVGEGLFTQAFYQDCFKILNDDGILVNQHESPFYEHYQQAMKRAHARLVETFPIAKVYQAHIPTYASGHWLFGFASKTYDPIRDHHPQVWEALGLKTKYYNSELHKACFALPTYVKEQLEEVK